MMTSKGGGRVEGDEFFIRVKNQEYGSSVHIFTMPYENGMQSRLRTNYMTDHDQALSDRI